MLPMIWDEWGNWAVCGAKSYCDINPIIFTTTKNQRFSGVLNFHLQICFIALLWGLLPRGVRWCGCLVKNILPLVNGYFHPLQVTSDFFSRLLASTPVSQKHLVQQIKHTAVHAGHVWIQWFGWFYWNQEVLVAIAICFANFEFAILARSANTQKPLLVGLQKNCLQ